MRSRPHVDRDRTDVSSEQGGVGGLITRSTEGELTSGSIAVRQLRVVFGDEGVGGRTILLRGERIYLGREPGPDGFAIDASEVSRRHASLERGAADGDAWTIADCGSRNGVFVDGVRIAVSTPLRHGAVVRVGPVLFVCEDTTIVAPLAANPVGRLIGNSMAMRHLRRDVRTVAPTVVPVLVEGETGAGKEVVAGALHEASGRSGPFVAVNCAAIPTELAEGELFGRVAGAYTGAATASRGLVAAAAGGTLFLDEIGELSLDAQAKLLRLLATGEVRAVGSSTPRIVDVRVVTATNRDLDAEVAAGRFRGDLLARIAVWRMPVPPLRQRREDILALTELFLSRERAPLRLTVHAAEALVLHAWPYNVRELEQTVRQIAVRGASGGVVRLEHLPAVVAGPLAARIEARPRVLPLAVMIDRTVAPGRDVLLRVLDHFAGNVTEAARFFGKDRKQVYRWAERLGIELAAEVSP
jgi:DNA-binding NtrC family response regulator